MKSVVVANKRELVSYAEAKTQVGASISATRDEIEALKVELDAARLERQHKVGSVYNAVPKGGRYRESR